jgi:lipid-binding SYLF domain-containing protein
MNKQRRNVLVAGAGVAVLSMVSTGCTTTLSASGDPAAQRQAIAGFYRMTEGSAGLLAGAQSQAVFILFMTEEALRRLETSSGWTVGADASVSMINVGANARITTQTARQEVIGFVMTNAGLMGSISLNGNRITRLDL